MYICILLNTDIVGLGCGGLLGVLERLRDEELAEGLGAELGDLVRRVGNRPRHYQRVQPGRRRQRL